jgi:PadR family transcriptional regulator PadR
LANPYEIMKGTHLGEFEELVLLAVGILDGDAYGVTVMDEIEAHTGRKVSVSTIHSTLNRLERKGFVQSYTGGASPVRGGRSKRLYRINHSGQLALGKVRMQRETLWNLLPKIS